MYEKNESGTWEYKQELTPSGSIDDGIEFGYDVKLAGDYLVASAPYDAYDEMEKTTIVMQELPTSSKEMPQGFGRSTKDCSK